MKKAKERIVDKEKYYTSKEAAENIVLHFKEQEALIWEQTRGIVEPSAGGGVFLDVLQNTILEERTLAAFDIEPTAPNIIACDFLTLQSLPFEGISPSDVLCIGNPPFGIRGSLARKFLNKCAEFSNNLLMILPISFKSPSFMSNVNEYFHIEWSLDLPDNIWTTTSGDSIQRKIKTAAFFIVRKTMPREKPQIFTFDSVNQATNGKWMLISTKSSNKKNNSVKADSIRKTDVALFLWGSNVNTVRDLEDFQTERYHVVRLIDAFPTKEILKRIEVEHVRVRKEKANRSTLGAMVATALPDLLIVMNEATK